MTCTTVQIWLWSDPPECNTDALFKTKACFEEDAYRSFFEEENKDLKSRVDFIPFDPQEREEFSSLFQEIFDKQIAQYKVDTANLTLFMQFLISLLIIGLLILLYRPKSLSIPIVGISLPVNLLFPAVIVGLVYFWLQFGLSLNAGIDGRMALHHMINYLEQFDGYQVDYKFSLKNTLADKAVLDTWCQHYFNILGRSNQGNSIISWLNSGLICLGLYVIYCTFWGLVHGVCIILMAEYYEMKKGLLKRVLYVIVLSFFILSHIFFLYEFPFATLTFAWVWMIVSLLILWWYFRGQEMAILFSKRHKNDFS